MNITPAAPHGGLGDRDTRDSVPPLTASTEVTVAGIAGFVRHSQVPIAHVGKIHPSIDDQEAGA